MPIGERVTFSGNHNLLAGDLIRVRRKEKNRSPYEIVNLVENETQVITSRLDDPSNGNRRVRRARYADKRKSKK